MSFLKIKLTKIMSTILIRHNILLKKIRHNILLKKIRHNNLIKNKINISSSSSSSNKISSCKIRTSSINKISSCKTRTKNN